MSYSSLVLYLYYNKPVLRDAHMVRLRCMSSRRIRPLFAAFDDQPAITADNVHATHTEYELCIVDDNIKNYNKVPSKYSAKE